MKPHFGSQKGQATMEAVLIMVIIAVVALKISSVAKNQGFVRNIVEGPWAPIRGMIEDGVWEKYTTSKIMHPNHKMRHQTKQGDAT